MMDKSSSIPLKLNIKYIIKTKKQFLEEITTHIFVCMSMSVDRVM
jgi:hypothetical protein